MSNHIQLNIHFGALAPKIATQLLEQKLKFDPRKVKRFQESNNCITQLMFDGILNDTQKNKAYDKLFTQIKAHVKTQNK